MEIFIQKLVKRLDSLNKEWRRSMVWILDNAKYHCSSSTLKVLEDHQVPVCFTGPNSYSAGKWFCSSFHLLLLLAPVELLFAAFKNGNINPRNVPTSKKWVNLCHWNQLTLLIHCADISYRLTGSCTSSSRASQGRIVSSTGTTAWWRCTTTFSSRPYEWEFWNGEGAFISFTAQENRPEKCEFHPSESKHI